jgi:3-dehydroquinate dehydratase-1
MLGAGPRTVLCVTDRRGGRLPRGARPDIVEARIDLFADRSPAHVETVLRRLRRHGIPIIATIRIAAEGGRWQRSDDEREALFRRVLPLVNAVDVELCRRTLARRVAAAARARGRRVIVSAHDFEGTPAATTLARRIRAARALGADIVKLAAQARGSEDVATLLRVLLGHGRTSLVVIAMGRAGVVSRIAFPAAGSLLTYASPDGEGPTAPGQLPLHTLQKELARYYAGDEPARR